MFKHVQLKDAVLFSAVVGVFPLLLGMLLGTPSSRRQKSPGAKEYIGRGALVNVLSLGIDAIIYTIWVGFGPVLLVLLPFAVLGGWITGGLLYLVHGRKWRGNTE